MRLPAANEYDPILLLSPRSLIVRHPAQSPGRALLGVGIGNTPGGPHGLNPGLLPVLNLQGPEKWTIFGRDLIAWEEQ